MTDLEDLWNSLPTGQPPTARILQQGRVRSRRWRMARRPLVSIGSLAALGGAFVAGTLVSGPPQLPGGGTTPDPAAPSPVSFQADLASAASCEELRASYVDRALGQVTAWGWESYGYHGYGRGVMLQNSPWLDVHATGLVPATAVTETSGRVVQRFLSVDRVTASESGTNVQEERVDEPDSVKSDGSLLVRLRDNELLTYDVSGPTVRELSALRLRGFEGGEILLSGKTVVVVGTDRRSARSEQTGARRGTRVQTVSLADPRDPEVTDDVTYGAAATSTRQHGDVVRMVLSAGRPDLAFVQPRKGLTAKAALVRNRNIVKRSRLRDWLPGYAAGGGRQDLLDCENVAVPPAAVGLDTTAVVTFAADSADSPRAFGLAGATTIAYESADHLYLASTPATEWRCFSCRAAQGGGRGTSHLFQFDLEDDRAVHVASGEVEGTLRDRWSLDEVGGQLRVLVGPSSETGNFNSVVTFGRRGTKLVEDGRLDHLGRGEEIKSVRWQDDLAMVVTFRQTDPLYVIDLRGKPKILSKLRVPGFSSYLHPLGEQRLIGVGSGPGKGGWGAQLGLFAVRDLRHVRRLDVWNYGSGSDAFASYDPRAFTWLPEHRTVLTVIQKGRTGWLSIQYLANNRLHNRMVRVEYGDDIAQVRTLGLPGGRVVLVTGEDIRFLEI
jgi:hypothetical protein